METTSSLTQNNYTNIIDLSRKLNNATTVYPGTLKPAITDSNTIEVDGFAEKELHICSHFGTHIDAPSHIIKEGKNLDDFPLDKYIGKALLIDVQNQPSIEIDTLQKINNIADLDFLIFRTGWEKYWHDKKYFQGFPVLSIEAARFIAGSKMKGIGIDAISPDHVGDENMEIHKILLGSDVLIVENLCNLNELPAKAFNFQCLPLKIEHADGSPVRAFAYF
jgi:kynurenine formamidase